MSRRVPEHGFLRGAPCPTPVEHQDARAISAELAELELLEILKGARERPGLALLCRGVRNLMHWESPEDRRAVLDALHQLAALLK